MVNRRGCTPRGSNLYTAPGVWHRGVERSGRMHRGSLVTLTTLLLAAIAECDPQTQVSVPFPAQGELKLWRHDVLQTIDRRCEHGSMPLVGHQATCDELDVYEFGVYTGRAMRGMSLYFNRSADKAARHEAFYRLNGSIAEYKKYTAADLEQLKSAAHGCCRRFWGFDSFQGAAATADATLTRRLLPRSVACTRVRYMHYLVELSTTHAPLTLACHSLCAPCFRLAARRASLESPRPRAELLKHGR